MSDRARRDDRPIDGNRRRNPWLDVPIWTLMFTVTVAYALVRVMHYCVTARVRRARDGTP